MDQVGSKLENAERIVNAYGDLLAKLEQVSYAHPLSKLPFEKQQIKQAIQTLLWELDDADDRIRNSLAQAYVYLAQFIPDTEVALLERGQSAMNGEQPDDKDLGYAEEAHRIMYHIKWEMEQAMEDMRLFLH
jgi:hypothetical protein